MTEVVATSSQPRHHSAPTGPLTRSTMAARPAGTAAAVARQHGSETSPAAPLPSSSPRATPPGPITRKRAASINTEEANRPKIEALSLTTPDTATPRPFDASRDLICLCTPAPKVPRPRNGMLSLLVGQLLCPLTSCFSPFTICNMSPFSLLFDSEHNARERHVHRQNVRLTQTRHKPSFFTASTTRPK